MQDEDLIKIGLDPGFLWAQKTVHGTGCTAPPLSEYAQTNRCSVKMHSPTSWLDNSQSIGNLNVHHLQPYLVIRVSYTIVMIFFFITTNFHLSTMDRDLNICVERHCIIVSELSVPYTVGDVWHIFQNLPAVMCRDLDSIQLSKLLNLLF